MVIEQINRLTDFELLLYHHIRVVQNNKLDICGKLLNVIPDDTGMGLGKLIIEQGFISSGKIGVIVRDSKHTVATVYTKNILTVERIG